MPRNRAKSEFVPYVLKTLGTVYKSYTNVPFLDGHGARGDPLVHLVRLQWPPIALGCAVRACPHSLLLFTSYFYHSSFPPVRLLNHCRRRRRRREVPPPHWPSSCTTPPLKQVEVGLLPPLVPPPPVYYYYDASPTLHYKQHCICHKLQLTISFCHCSETFSPLYL